MSTTAPPQAIEGAETQSEREVMVNWPSLAASGIGCWIGRVFESAPDWRIWGVRWTYGPPALAFAPLALLLYTWNKILWFGQRYTLTSDRIRVLSTRGGKLFAEVALDAIDEVAMVVQPGQGFYSAADLVLQSDSGGELLRLPGVVRPEVFRKNILKARDARRQVQAALETIAAREA